METTPKPQKPGRSTQDLEARAKHLEENMDRIAKVLNKAEDKSGNAEPAPAAPATPAASAAADPDQAAVAQAAPAQAQPEPATPKTPERKVWTAEEEIKGAITEFGLGPIMPPEFETLTEPQKLKVIRDLKQRIVDIVKSDGRTQYSQAVKNEGQGSFFKRVALSLFKESKARALEKNIFEKLKSDPQGKALIAKDFQTLTERARGKAMGTNSQGDMWVNYLNEPPENEQERKLIFNFNEKADAFARLPYEWSQEKGGKNKLAYELAKAEYERARAEVLAMKKAKEQPGQEGFSMYQMLRLDNEVQMEQALNTHPEYEHFLGDLARDRTKAEAIKAWGRDILKRAAGKNANNVLLAVGGYATRAATASIIGAVAVPAVGALVGGLRAKIRAKENLEERKILARRGQKDESIERARMVDVRLLINGLEKMFIQAKTAATPEEALKAISKLAVLIEHTEGQIEKGQVNFGDAKNALKNQFDLLNSLNQAAGFKAIHTGEASTEIKTKIDEMLATYAKGKDARVVEAQNKFIRNQILKGAATGASFATAGYLLRMLGEAMGLWEGHTPQAIRDATPAADADQTPGQTPAQSAPSQAPAQPGAATAPGAQPDAQAPGQPGAPAQTPDAQTSAPSAQTGAPAPDGLEKQVLTFDSGKGGIQGLLDFKKQIREFYNNDFSNAPAAVQELMKETNVVKQAQELGFFDPTQAEESANIMKGSTLRFENGKLIFHDARTGQDVEKYAGRMFDYDGRVKVGQEIRLPAGPGMPSEPIPGTPEDLGPGAAQTAAPETQPSAAAVREDVNKVHDEIMQMYEEKEKPKPNFSTGENYVYDSRGVRPQAQYTPPQQPASWPPEPNMGTNYVYGPTPRPTLPPEIAEEVRIMRSLPSEFRENHFNLPPTELKEVYEIYKTAVDQLLPQDNSVEWPYVKNLSASEVMKPAGPYSVKPNLAPLLDFLRRLEDATGLEPKGGLFRKEESLGEYMARVMEKAKDNGDLEDIVRAVR